MKKALIILAGVFFKALIIAQTIPNSSFESWSIKNLFNEPNGFTSSNLWSYTLTGSGNVKKVADAYHGIFATRLETVSSGLDTIQGLLLIGTPGNQTIDGGVPYTAMPDSVSGYVKKNIQPGDTANFMVLLKSDGIITGIARAYFTGITTDYQRFSVPVSYFGGPPDSMAAVISSSKMDPPFYPGSNIIIDSISFIGSVQPFPNGSFESWKAINTEEPNNWATLNYASVSSGKYPVTKSTDSYEGVYSMRLESMLSPTNDTLCLITNGKFRENTPVGGMSVSANPQKITGYYKYLPYGPDTAFAKAATYYFDEVKGTTIRLDSALIQLVPSADYTYFEIPLSYQSTPVADTLSLIFSSSNIKENSIYAGSGSVLLLDKINIIYFPSLGANDFLSEYPVTVFPNPSTGEITFYIPSLKGENNVLEIYDILGKVVLKQRLNSTQKTVLLNAPKGIYFYKVTSGNKQVHTGKITIEK